MPDYSLPPCVTLTFGRSGSGKTTFCFRYLANALTPQEANHDPAAAVFVFDWKLEASKRFGVEAVCSEHGFESALAGRLVVFNPHPMFPGDRRVTSPEGDKVLNDEKMALRWFCKRVFECSQRGPGKKIVYIDELAQFNSRFNLSPEISRIARLGRAEHLELLISTQYPRDYHSDLRGAVTEWVCFQTTEPPELDAVRPYYAHVDAVAALPMGSYLAYNRNTGRQLPGRLW